MYFASRPSTVRLSIEFMKGRPKKILILCLLATVIGLIILLSLKREPTYKGKNINAWLDDYAVYKPTDWQGALSHIGTNSLPYAVRNLAQNDSKWRRKYSDLWPKFPPFLQKILHKPKPLLKEVHGANVFSYIGTNSIPHAIALLKHESPTVRRSAAWGISSLRHQSIAANQAIPALIEALDDKDAQARFDACLALIEMGPDASNAVPALTTVFNNKGSSTNSLLYLRAVAARTLGKIGPSAAGALPVLKTALQETDPYLLSFLAAAIWRIDSDVETALPVLLQELPKVEVYSRWDPIIALGEMGPRGKAAFPLLTTQLTNHWAEVRECATNSLVKIDPEAAAKIGVTAPRTK
jgi:HEAT repeats